MTDPYLLIVYRDAYAFPPVQPAKPAAPPAPPRAPAQFTPIGQFVPQPPPGYSWRDAPTQASLVAKCLRAAGCSLSAADIRAATGVSANNVKVTLTRLHRAGKVWRSEPGLWRWL